LWVSQYPDTGRESLAGDLSLSSLLRIAEGLEIDSAELVRGLRWDQDGKV
jgi:hypothetical protein